MTIQFVDDAIRRARLHDSVLDQSVLDIKGFSTGVMRRLISNLCEGRDQRCYVEVGAFTGGTACAAINNKEDLHAYIFEDFSQAFGNPDVREQLEHNLLGTRMGPGTSMDLIVMNYLMALYRILEPVDIYFYDGEHSLESQSEALLAMFDKLAPTFLFIVDDTNWESVWHGTAAGFKALERRLEITHSWKLVGQQRQDDPVWHNGMALFLCSKV